MIKFSNIHQKDTAASSAAAFAKNSGFRRITAAICAFAVLFLVIGAAPVFAEADAETEEYNWNTGGDTVGPIQASRYFIPDDANLYADTKNSDLVTKAAGGWTTNALNDGSYAQNQDILMEGRDLTATDGATKIMTFIPESDCVIIEFGQACEISSIMIGASTADSTKGYNWAQSLRQVQISYFDDANGEWEQGEVLYKARVDLVSSNTDNLTKYTEYNPKPIANKTFRPLSFSKIYTTTKLRVEFIQAAREKNLAYTGITELIPYGKVLGQVQAGGDYYIWNIDSESSGYVEGDYSVGFDAEQSASVLKDGVYGDASYVTFTKTDGAYDENQYIDINFEKKIFDISKITVGISEDDAASSVVTGVQVDYIDTVTGEWVTGGSYSIKASSYKDYDASVRNKTAAVINLSKTYSTPGLRIRITDSTGDSVNVSELIPEGKFNRNNTGVALWPSVMLGFKLDTWASEAEVMVDGKYSGKYVAHTGSEKLGSDRLHAKMYFDGKKAEISALEIGSWQNRTNQRLKAISIEYFDTDTNKWVMGNQYSLSYTEVLDEDNAVKSTIVFAEPIVTTRLKVNFLSSTGTTPIITECMPFGRFIDGGESNTAQSANSVEVTGGDAEAMLDGKLSTGISADITGENAISAENPYSIVFDFGTEYKNIDSFEIFSKDAAASGITSMKVYYEKNAEWIKAAEFDYTYDEGLATDNMGAADGTLDITANKIKLDIIDAPIGAEILNINEVYLYDKDISDLSPLEKAIRMFKFTGKYSYYTEAGGLILSYNGADKAELQTEIDSITAAQLGLERMEFAFDVPTSKVAVKGYAFKPQGDIEINFTSEKYPSYTGTVAVDENGIVDDVVDISSYSDGGETTASIELDSGSKTGSFTARLPKTGKELVSFSVDGVAAAINGSTVTLKLPAGSTLKKRIPFFEISDGAVLKYDDTVLESGKTAVDLVNGKKLTVFAENLADNTEYTLAVSVASSSNGGSGSSGGGGGSSGGGSIYIPDDIKQDSEQPAAQDKVMIFDDVSGDFWGYEAIKKLYDKGIINGVSENSFEPEALVTRGEFIKMLTLLFGIEPSEEESGFEDVNGHWARTYVAAAAVAGIVNGKTDGSFGVDDSISRQDTAVMIYRILKPEEASSDKEFSDADEIEDYAIEAVKALSGLGLINGYEDGSFRPGANLTRAEAAAMLARIR